MTDKDLQSIKNRYGIIGNTPSLNYALTTATQVSNTDLTVLISGESGVGKEVFSQIIHSLSTRKHNPFIAINCGAIPEGTIDSELFGHEKGSFTSAVDARKGYFETVNGGTIFLDEIGEMPLITQARLLRVLETGEFIRVGSSKVQKTNVRIIAATNRDLLQQVQGGRFREDLYYRLSTVPIKVPSLRERKEDILQLFRKFCVDFAEKYRTQPVQLSDDAKQTLMQYPWPGNIRELKNIAEQISVLSQNKNISGSDLQIFLPNHPISSSLPTLARNNNLNNGSAQDFHAEKEILYQLFFDLKKDVTELKKILLKLIESGNSNAYDILSENMSIFEDIKENEDDHIRNKALPTHQNDVTTNLNIHSDNLISESEDAQFEEIITNPDVTLSLEKQEKEIIIRALKKNKNKRKYAAKDLGISERTLYRKIKQYDLEDNV